jgi:hypothetical protein
MYWSNEHEKDYELELNLMSALGQMQTLLLHPLYVRYRG